jgi:hypothetical protein
MQGYQSTCIYEAILRVRNEQYLRRGDKEVYHVAIQIVVMRDVGPVTYL